MEPIEITERDGYLVMKLKHSMWKARGRGESGEILFCPGPVTPCSFMKKVPKGSGWIFGQEGMTSRLQWRDEEGVIHSCKNEDCCRGMLQLAYASAPITARLSNINLGSKSKGFFSPKDEQGNISVIALFLALMITPEKPEYLREELIDAINQHPNLKIQFKDDWDEDSPYYGSAYDKCKTAAKDWIFNFIEMGGSAALIDAANLLDKIERKQRKLEKSETDFLKAVGKSATIIFDVPTQKAVRKIWMSQQAGRNEKQFRDVRDRLGFTWLPAAKRGKNSH